MARSPNYPKLSLEEAVERAKQIYKAEHLHLANKDVVAQDLGYKSLNGSSARIVSALKNYGLLDEPERDKVRVSDDAMTVLELPNGNNERTQVLRSMAFAPQVFADLQETYKGSPPSDVNIRHYLIRKKYLPGAADEVIRLYRDNLSFIADEDADNVTESVEDDQSETTSLVQPVEEALNSVTNPVDERAGGTLVEPQVASNPTKVLQFQISEDSAARIELTGRVTQEAIEMLAAILNAQKLVFPKRIEIEEPLTE